jgi:peroxiredoxin
MNNLYQLPDNLPIPEDDGATAHLVGQKLPNLMLPTTAGRAVDLSAVQGWLVIYCYPMTGQPGVALPEGWDDIPGARGCTPQSCAFRDYYSEIKQLGADVFGVSTQASEYQQELVERLHLPFEVVSDANLEFASALRLPTLTLDGLTLFKRLTLISYSSVIHHVNYPVFPPYEDPVKVISWLKSKV